MLVDSAKRALGDVAALEKQALAMRKAACSQIIELKQQEGKRTERLRAEADEVAKVCVGGEK